MALMEMVEQLTKGYIKATGKQPGNLEKLKIQEEAIKRFKEMNKVVDMKGNPINPAEGILGGQQAQNFSKKLDPALYEDRGGNIIPAQFDESPAFPSYTAKETEEQIRQRLLKNNKDGIASMKSKLDDVEDLSEGTYSFGFKKGKEFQLNASSMGKGSLKEIIDSGELVGDDLDFAISILRDRKADGGRAGFMAGGMGRRGFLKLLGGVGAGIGALKSGILGFGGKKAGTQVAKEVTKEVATSGAPPPHFLKLVAKIKALGDDAPKLAVKDKEVVTKYKDYTLTEDVVTGEKTIQRMKIDDDLKYDASEYYGKPIGEEVYMSYKPGKGQADETMKGKTPLDEYTEDTSLIRADKPAAGEVMDTFDGVPDDIIQEAMEETIKIGKADGGRIGYKIGSSKKGVQSFLDLIRNKFGKESITTADKIPLPNDTLKRNMFDAANKRFNKSTTPESEKIVGDILEDTDINDLFDADGKLNKDAVLKAATSKDVDKEILGQYSPENAVDDIFPSGDYKYDADIAAEAYVENNPQMFKNMLYEDLDDRTRSEVYSKVLAVINQRNAKMLQTKRNAKSIDISNDSVAEDFTNFIKKTDPDGFKKLEQRLLLENAKKPKNRKLNASGGLAAMLGE